MHRAKELDHRLRILTSAANLISLCSPTIAPAFRLCSLFLPYYPMPTRTNAARDTNPSGTGAPPRAQSNSYRDSTLGIFALLLAFRIVNALTLRTFFQPDEFFQSLEPAWQLAFGPATHAWITWVILPSSAPSSPVSSPWAGVEIPIEVVPASSAIRSRLSSRGTCC